jgi:hypothetical protein
VIGRISGSRGWKEGSAQAADPTGKSVEFSDLALLAVKSELPKSRARKIQFRVVVQADLGGPVLRAKIIHFH